MFRLTPAEIEEAGCFDTIIFKVARQNMILRAMDLVVISLFHGGVFVSVVRGSDQIPTKGNCRRRKHRRLAHNYK